MNNQILKNLYSKLSQSSRLNGEEDFKNFERADKIITWIVGFSIGTFVILLSRDIPTRKGFIEGLTNEIMVVSLIIVILGLLFRLFSFFTQMLLSQIISSFCSYAEIFASTPEIQEAREIDKSADTNDLLCFLEEDFGIKMRKPDYKKMSVGEIMQHRDKLYNLYIHLSESNKIENQLEEFKTMFSNHSGLSKKAIDSKSQMKRTIFRGKFYRVLLYCSYVLFFLTIGTFIFGTFVILNKLLIQI